ncbi:dihydrodipicolinate synthase family protein [Arthrobacter jiangjiafuii]|uniref:Dihydrodipicolinate synthase family protein n=1 Tax=Arthrobacter jiangjiafuii TaxID=2817475 RepID=A0A975M658_9MICC|nr:dihydrodipicolinate synthase family protein [Arthrobacter jiangjiafuii]MBP3043642.1 dihydrodipicolinate synthase family protein [Arthrobacter jiangjiafuii]QWC10681.1 dihydrodipicolinate synthase family protein [Arthrobacter jiangjiafuii]
MASQPTPQFHGVIPPVVTPRTADGRIDTASLTRLTKHLIEGGVHGLFVLGSSAEVPYLTNDERELVVTTIAGVNAGQVPLIVGACEQTTARVIEEGARMVRLGADALVVTSQFYAISDARETDTHFRSIHAALDVPLFAYDVPVRTHFKLPLDLLLQLGRDGVIAGVKDSSGDDVSFRQLSLGARGIDNFSIFTGHEVVVDGALLGGADGVVPGLGNVDPAGYRRLYDAAKSGDFLQAAAEQDRLADVFNIVYTPTPGRVSGGAGGLGAFKTALMLMGVIDTNVMSAPMVALNEPETAAIATILERNGLI